MNGGGGLVVGWEGRERESWELAGA